MRLPKLKLGTKLTLVFAAITTLPLIAVNVLWFYLMQQQFVDVTNNTAFIIIGIMLIALTTIFMISHTVTTKITKPIENLQEGTRNISKGNLDYRLQIKTGDEIEELANTFNSMAANLQEAFHKLENDKNIISAERNKIALTLASIADIVITTDLNKNITIFNKAAEKLTGLREQDVLGKKITDIIKLYKKDKTSNLTEVSVDEYCPITSDCNEGVVFSASRLLLKTVNGNEKFINIITGKIKDGAATNLCCILTLHDVTKEEELETMKLDFVSITAHELRTPLTSIRGYLSLFMMQEINLNEQQKKFLTRVTISTEQLIALVENILNVSRIERGMLSIDIQKIDWLPIVTEIVNSLKDRAIDKHIEVSFIQPIDKLPQVYADKFRISQVLTNLIANAVNYTHENGKIEVSVEQKDNELITHIKDNGEGIPKEALPHLFTKFFRVSGQLEQGSKGTGLGLYISKAIIEAHQGRMYAESELGKGSTFSFTLPCVKNQTSASEIKLSQS
jgi:PAS domain S-box-containing protein